ncbi:MAG: hypothetical protein HKP62_02320, partial [Sulfurovum sp.]|nr:hypothetical protein [Sulfurovum sp.]NNJ44828.1 hypothetical protein [Sulfurovum sp.]
MPVGGFARVVGDVARFNYMATHLITRTKEDLSKALEKSARELEGTMKRGIVHREFGLTSNTDLTQILKGGNIPLVASSQLVQNITASKLNADQSKKVSDALV